MDLRKHVMHKNVGISPVMWTHVLPREGFCLGVG